MEKNKQPSQPIPELSELIIEDTSYRTQLNTMYRNRKPYQAVNPSHLKSFMPGNIPDVFVKEGDHVKSGDTLLILEAMKMKNLIKAPFDGIIKRILVKQGDKVPKNAVLIEIDEKHDEI
jgi:biotin carboxyl carrier protein